MLEVLDRILPNSRVSISGTTLRVTAKCIYVTQTHPDTPYGKVFLQSHHALVICPLESFAYWGRDVTTIGIDPPFPDQISYCGHEYRMVAHDYQIVKRFEFGDILQTEGEVEFWDFQCVGDSSRLISAGVVKRTLRRADIVAQVIHDASAITVLGPGE